MPLYGCGFNAHNQVTDETTDDIGDFRQVSAFEDVRFLFTGWSETAYFANNKTLIRAGVVTDANALPKVFQSSWDEKPLACGFGDSSRGLRGAIDVGGTLHLARQDGTMIASEKAETTPRISLAAMAGNGNTMISYQSDTSSADAHPMTELLQFRSVEDFFHWYKSATLEPLETFKIRGSARQLVANAVGFTLLTEGGEVYTWGDYRYPACVGRDVTSDCPARVPGLVEELGGVRVTKIASGGWITMAITSVAEGFVWGISEPGTSNDGGLGAKLDEKGGPATIMLPQEGDEFEEFDIFDIAVGSGHGLLLDGKAQVWSTGKNSHGQLGIERLSEMETGWCKVRSVQDLVRDGNRVTAVACGALTSFVVVQEEK